MTKLNIAVVCDSIDLTKGGAEISARRFITALKNRGHRITLITNIITRPDSLFFKDLTVYKSLSFRSKRYVFGYIRRKKLEQIYIENNIDVVYSVYPISILGIKSRLICKKLNIPLIGHFHVQIGNVLEGIKNEFLTNKAQRIISSFYNMCDLILCPTFFAQSYILNSNIKTPTAVISNGVNLNFFKCQKNLKK